jgi:hypothetical protein
LAFGEWHSRYHTAEGTGLEKVGLGDLLPEPRQEGAAVVLFSDQELGILQLTVDLLDVAFWGHRK